MASSAIIVGKMGANDFDWNLALIIERDAISIDRGNFKLVIDIEHHILRLLIHSAEQYFAELILVRFFNISLRTRALTSLQVLFVYAMLEIVLLSFTILKFLQRYQSWDRFVEDVVLEILQNFALPRILQPLALAQIDIVRKGQIDTSIEIFVVIVLIGY